jgi:ATP-dependent NAD(P)H-hydrate dehydratase
MSLSASHDSSNRSPTTFASSKPEALQKCVLPLTATSHKGSSGRIGVLGGSARYAGAPYYAAAACLQAGADLAYVFTAAEAALPIKCYSPELMVAPVYSAAAFDQAAAAAAAAGSSSSIDAVAEDSSEAKKLVDDMVQQVVDGMQRLHCLVIGPGLGRCPLVFRAVAAIIAAAREQNMHLILDADALYMLTLAEYRDILQGYDKVILTPNVVEYKRLFGDNSNDEDNKDCPTSLALAVIVEKGRYDKIYANGTMVYTCGEEGGLKRSGGIGDILAGSLGTLTAWHVILKDQGVASAADLPLSCWTACCFVRRATKTAFDSKRRSMTAPDVLEQLGPSINVMVD